MSLSYDILHRLVHGSPSRCVCRIAQAIYSMQSGFAWPFTPCHIQVLGECTGQVTVSFSVNMDPDVLLKSAEQALLDGQALASNSISAIQWEFQAARASFVAYVQPRHG